jgi:hypothetical protein
MNYYVSRGGQQYGPYSFADLQKYVAAGNIVPADMAKGEGMQGWVTVQQVLAGIGVPPPPPPAHNYGPAPVDPQPAASPAIPRGTPGEPLPPGLHWGLVLLFAVLTCGIFGWVWMFLQAVYVRKLLPGSNAMLYYAIGLPATLIGAVLSVVLDIDSRLYGSLVELGGCVVIIVGHFNLKSSLEELFHIQLSSAMTFFFNTLFFQYHLTRIRDFKTTGVRR